MSPLQDEDRLKQAVNTVPDHAALNAMIARSPEVICCMSLEQLSTLLGHLPASVKQALSAAQCGDSRATPTKLG